MMPAESLASGHPVAGPKQFERPDAPAVDVSSVPDARARFAVDTAWCAAGLLGVVAYAVWALGARFALWTPSLAEANATVNGTAVALYVAAAVLQWRASRSPHLDAATRSAWRLMFVTNFGAFALSGTGTVRALLGDTSAGGPLWQAAQPILYLATNGLAVLALLRFPVSPKSAADRATFLLDAGTVGAAAMLLAWYLLFRGAIAQTQGGALHATEALAYPASDVLWLFATLALLLRHPLRSSATALRVLALAAAISVAADVPTVFDVLAAGAAKAEPYFIVYMVAAWLTGTSGYLQTRNAARDAGVARDVEAPAGTSVSWMPYIAVVLVYASLAFEAYRAANAVAAASHRATSASTLLVLVAGAAVVTSFVVARQVVAVRRNAELVADRLSREAYFRALVERSSDMFVVVERDGRIREASPAFARAAGVTPLSLRGTPFIDCIDDSDRETASADLASIAAESGDTVIFEWRVRALPHAAGEPAINAPREHRWIEVVCTNLLGDAAVRALVLNGRDVSERKQLETELLHRADHDALTGLANSWRFVGHVARAVERRRRSAGGFALLYVDLDGFKPINDAHGHAAGDAVLMAVAERLRAATRGSDLVSRLGGDEFALYLDAIGEPGEVDLIARRVLAALAQPIRLPGAHGAEVAVGCSIGVSISPPTAVVGDRVVEVSEIGDPVQARRTAEALLQQADAAMYTAKASGGGRHVYAPQPHAA